MAYFIFNNENDLYKIALNETEKGYLNLDETKYTVKEVSDDLFNKKRLDGGDVTLSGDTVTVADRDWAEGYGVANATDLKDQIELHKVALKETIKSYPDHTNISAYQNYLNTLNNFDADSLTYPLTDECWEKYCENNSITWIHPLQTP
tara:strand:- start:327 stop:770 length:444 start_codon:yes stop_codon:yes gene_type:complete